MAQLFQTAFINSERHISEYCTFEVYPRSRYGHVAVLWEFFADKYVQTLSVYSRAVVLPTMFHIRKGERCGLVPCKFELSFGHLTSRGFLKGFRYFHFRIAQTKYLDILLYYFKFPIDFQKYFGYVTQKHINVLANRKEANWKITNFCCHFKDNKKTNNILFHHGRISGCYLAKPKSRLTLLLLR